MSGEEGGGVRSSGAFMEPRRISSIRGCGQRRWPWLPVSGPVKGRVSLPSTEDRQRRAADLAEPPNAASNPLHKAHPRNHARLSPAQIEHQLAAEISALSTQDILTRSQVILSQDKIVLRPIISDLRSFRLFSDSLCSVFGGIPLVSG